jgi:hypothetical protein
MSEMVYDTDGSDSTFAHIIMLNLISKFLKRQTNSRRMKQKMKIAVMMMMGGHILKMRLISHILFGL